MRNFLRLDALLVIADASAAMKTLCGDSVRHFTNGPLVIVDILSTLDDQLHICVCLHTLTLPILYSASGTVEHRHSEAPSRLPPAVDTAVGDC